MLSHIITKIGWPLRSHLEPLLDTIVPLLGDARIVVRQSTTKLLNKLMHALTPKPVLSVLLSGMSNPSWRVREELVNVAILSLSSFEASQLDLDAMTAALVLALGDSKSRVKLVVLEAMAVLRSLLGEEKMWQQLSASGSLSNSARHALEQRFASTQQLPNVTNDGLVEHAYRGETPSSMTPSRAGAGYSALLNTTNGASTARLPWAATPPPATERKSGGASRSPVPSQQQQVIANSGLQVGNGNGNGNGSARPQSPTLSVGAHSTSSRGAGGSYADIYRAKLEGRSSSLHRSNSRSSVAKSTTGSPDSYLALAQRRKAASVAEPPAARGKSPGRGTSPAGAAAAAGRPLLDPLSSDESLGEGMGSLVAGVRHVAGPRRSSSPAMIQASPSPEAGSGPGAVAVGGGERRGAGGKRLQQRHASVDDEVFGASTPERTPRAGGVPRALPGAVHASTPPFAVPRMARPASSTSQKDSAARESKRRSAAATGNTTTVTHNATRNAERVEADEPSRIELRSPPVAHRSRGKRNTAPSAEKAAAADTPPGVATATTSTPAVAATGAMSSTRAVPPSPTVPRSPFRARHNSTASPLPFAVAAPSGSATLDRQKTGSSLMEPGASAAATATASGGSRSTGMRSPRPRHAVLPDSTGSAQEHTANTAESMVLQHTPQPPKQTRIGGRGPRPDRASRVSPDGDAAAGGRRVLPAPTDLPSMAHQEHASSVPEARKLPRSPAPNRRVSPSPGKSVAPSPSQRRSSRATPPVPSEAPAAAAAAGRSSATPPAAFAASSRMASSPPAGAQRQAFSHDTQASASVSASYVVPEAVSHKAVSYEASYAAAPEAEAPAGFGASSRMAHSPPLPAQGKSSRREKKTRGSPPIKRVSASSSPLEAISPSSSPTPAPAPFASAPRMTHSPPLPAHSAHNTAYPSSPRSSTSPPRSPPLPVSCTASRAGASSPPLPAATAASRASRAAFEADQAEREDEYPGDAPTPKTPVAVSAVTARKRAARERSPVSPPNAEQTAGSSGTSPTPSSATLSPSSAAARTGASSRRRTVGGSRRTGGSSTRSGNSASTTASATATTAAAAGGPDRSMHRTVRGGNPGDAFLVPLSEMRPLSSGFDAVLKQAKTALAKGENQETWIEKCEGLEMLRRLVLHDTEAVCSNVREVVELVMTEVRNLRSSVSRLAILALGDMYEKLGRAMDKSLDATVLTLQNKAGAEASTFIKQDVAESLERMVEHMSNTRALIALLACMEHKTKDVRRTTCRLVSDVAQRLGPKVLSNKETPRFIRLVAKALTDSDQEVRYWARFIAAGLMEQDNLEAIAAQHLSGELKRSFESALDSIRTKGVEQTPAARSMRRTNVAASPGLAASTRRHRARPPSTAMTDGTDSSPASQPGSAATRRSSASRHGTSARTGAGVHGATRRSAAAPAIRGADGGDRLKDLSTQLQASDWRAREQAVGELQALVQQRATDFVGTNMNVFFDFVPRLCDSNSKVNVAALQALEGMLPLVGGAMDTVMGELLPSLAHNLASKTHSIRDGAAASLGFIATGLDSALVLQPLCTTAVNANGVVQEGLIPFLATAVATAAADPRTSRLVQRYAVSACAKLANEKKLQASLAGAWRELHRALGDELFKHKAMKPAVLAHVKDTLG